MALNVGHEMTALRSMTVRELQQKYHEVFGEPTRMHHRQYLVKRILWRMQAIAAGDLSERARQRALELADDANLRIYEPAKPATAASAPELTRTVPVRFPSDGRLPMPGAHLTRRYKGRLITVEVRPDGFKCDGQVYETLSAVARAVTGTRWNGFHFFKLGKYGKAE